MIPMTSSHLVCFCPITNDEPPRPKSILVFLLASPLSPLTFKCYGVHMLSQPSSTMLAVPRNLGTLRKPSHSLRFCKISLILSTLRNNMTWTFLPEIKPLKLYVHLSLFYNSPFYIFPPGTTSNTYMAKVINEWGINRDQKLSDFIRQSLHYSPFCCTRHEVQQRCCVLGGTVFRRNWGMVQFQYELLPPLICP